MEDKSTPRNKILFVGSPNVPKRRLVEGLFKLVFDSRSEIVPEASWSQFADSSLIFPYLIETKYFTAPVELLIYEGSASSPQLSELEAVTDGLVMLFDPNEVYYQPHHPHQTREKPGLTWRSGTVS